jgi:hypothetical protein
MGYELLIDGELHHALLQHLFKDKSEQVAFLFASFTSQAISEITVFDSYLVPVTGFDLQSGFHVTLSDEIRANVVKWAWDKDASLIEVHSHFSDPAAMSYSDLAGLKEFVPHVWWRLQAKPYGALVIAPNSFDALLWIDSPEIPTELSGVRVSSGELQTPTGLTYQWILRGEDGEE